MIIQTKKYKMPISLYVKLGLKNVLRMQWWIVLTIILFMSLSWFFRTAWFIIGGFIVFFLYLAFWIAQFYGLAQLEENHIMFDRISYTITSQQLMLQVNSKQGMPIPWVNFIKVYRKDNYFLLVLSKVQFFYLPFKIFQNENELKIFATILHRRGLLK